MAMKTRLSGLIVMIICVTILLVLNAMAVFAYRDAVLTAQTNKDNFLNFAIKYNTLLSELRTNANLYINTNDERYRTHFFLLRNEYLKNDNFTLKYRAYTENEASVKLREKMYIKGFSLSTQADYMAFNKSEQALYSSFLVSYNQIISILTDSIEKRDISILMNPSYDELNKNQYNKLTTLMNSYINRVSTNEDAVIKRQHLLEMTLVLLSMLLLILSAFTFYTILKENGFNLYFRQLYNTVVENIDVGITILDKDLNLEYMNSKYKEIMCITCDHTQGKSIRDIFDQSIVETIENATMYENIGNSRVDFNFGHLKKHIIYSHFTIYDEEGNNKYVHLLQDTTSTDELQLQLRKQLKEIEFYSHAKDSFIANISHEIKTPINAILGMVHFLKSTRLSQNQKDLVRKIETSSDILLTIISDVLDLSKIKSKSLSLYPSDFCLSQVIKNVEDMFSGQFSNKPIQWKTEFEFDPELCIHLDKTRFVQVLVNLINNAIKFTEKGHIKLTVETLFENEQTVHLQFCVEDTGIGIAEKDISKLFHEFEQLENHLTKQHQGTGLGLFICKNIIESMDGRMWVKSVKGSGSSFYFSIPVAKALNQSMLHGETANVISSVPLDGGGVKALVVEDTEINVEVAVRLLNDIHISCDTAPDGLAAVQMCKDKEPDYYKIIFMDIHMPIMDGYTAASTLRKSMGVKSPIIALTATDINDDVRTEHADTIDEFLLKPFKASAFYQTVSNYLKFNDTVKPFDSPPQTNTENTPRGSEKNSEDPFSGRKEAIKNLGGIESIYYKHVEKFKVNYAKSTEHVISLLEDQNPEEARRLVHSIKGLGGTLGMLNLQDASAALEKAIMKGSDYNLTVELEDFDRELKAVIAAI